MDYCLALIAANLPKLGKCKPAVLPERRPGALPWPQYQAAQQNLADVLMAVAAGRKRLALAKKSLRDLDANQDASRLVRGAAKAGGATGEGWLASAKPK